MVWGLINVRFNFPSLISIFYIELVYFFIPYRFRDKMQDHFGDTNPGCPDYNHLSDFKYILANQHSKQFHLIDSPDLIYELSQYKFRQDKPAIVKDDNSSSFNKNV